MTRFTPPLGLLLAFSALTGAQTPAPKPAAEAPAPPVDPAVVRKDASYALGFQLGERFSGEYGRFGITADDIESTEFMKGFVSSLKGGNLDLPKEKVEATMVALGKLLEEREQQLAARNLEEGKKFLETNGKRAGVVTTKSGLQYEVLTKGGDRKYTAPKDGKEDNKEFLVHFKGFLHDGTPIDASPEGEPARMSLHSIDGFREALTTMPVGAKWKIFVPATLAYGDERRSVLIGPNQTLVFEFELVDIKDAAAGGGFALPPGAGGGGFTLPPKQ